MKKLIFTFIAIISGCASHNDISNNDEIYKLINDYTTRKDDFKSKKKFKLARKSYEYDWTSELHYPDRINLHVDMEEYERIVKLYDDVLEDPNYNKKIYDSTHNKYRQKYMIKNDSLDKIYKKIFQTDSDSFLSPEDFEYMKKQIVRNAQNPIKWDKKKLINVTFDNKANSFSIPVFSKDGNFAIIYSHSGGGADLIYFRKEEGKWKRIGRTLAWIS